MWGPAAAVAVPVAAPSSGTIKVPQQPEASDIEYQVHLGLHIPPSHIPPWLDFQVEIITGNGIIPSPRSMLPQEEDLSNPKVGPTWTSPTPPGNTQNFSHINGLNRHHVRGVEVLIYWTLIFFPPPIEV